MARERGRTLGAAESHHFNAAGAALPSAAVVTTVVDHLRLEETIGGYEAAALVKDEYEGIYAAAAAVLGCDPDEIALFDSASTALRVIIDALRPAPGTRIIASRSTYVSHALHLMTLVREGGVELLIAPTDASRCVDLAALADVLADGRPTILSVAHVPTSSGLVEPVVEIGDLARQYGATYLLDATQSVGQLCVDVRQIGCHALVTTGRKFLRAPRGTALAYVDRAFGASLAPAAPDVRGSRWSAERDWEVVPGARRFETWESGVAARLGLGEALREVIERGMPATAVWLSETAATVRTALRRLPGVVVVDPDGCTSGIVTFVVGGIASDQVVARLAERMVRVVSVPASHGQWDLGDRAIESVVRASPHVYNDEQDIAALIEGVAALAQEVNRS
ncbi:aminotransferase class V-fold PLP-dependent enzyme [Microbacterium sp. A204]|uniref:aminotransferase class V-fold PLP-dependent enzyme n=1 Tax=Microbacterium sp. A204 TaxID=3457321 RepID=UPI003FCF8FD1